ncbi:TlpA family protein disulfide reductase [Methylobacillus flagellatus]|uniref:TlpA family protein disulfide reductase n=1 Tax=Methylobacillus flagellatus TaxID=405 RepID=UPI0028541110|nr:TlpA disulfide reductase family protein [Methylobacillus flagellatus]MDR5172156.1 TlpA family protein disulfide reductase [Methylobacillus flagellatus]
MTPSSNKGLSKRGFFVLALALAAAILLIQQYASKPRTAHPVETFASTAPFFAAQASDLQDTEQPLSQWQGQLLVVNFWATWCAPCREEMPELAELAREYAGKLVVLGISLDNVEKMQAFAQGKPMPYPLLSAEEEGMKLSASLGNLNSVVPHTVIIGSDGKILKSYFGRVTKALLLETLQPAFNS